MPAVISPVPPPRKLAHRLVRRLRQLLDSQAGLLEQCRNEGAPEQIHELRAVSRRLRVLLGLAGPFLGRKRTRRLVRHTRRLSRATGRLRDLDVTLALSTASPDQMAALRRRRHRLWLRRRGDLTAPDGPQSGLGRLEKSAEPLTRRYRRKLEQHRRTLLAGVDGLPTRPLAAQHAFRRTVRRLRYLRELALPRRSTTEDTVCRTLIRTQTALGRMLDDSVCRTCLARRRAPAAAAPPQPPAAAPGRTLRELASVLARWRITRRHP